MTSLLPRSRTGAARGAALLLALCAAIASPPLWAEKIDAARLPEKMGVEPLAPADGQRIYLSDPAMGHLVDGRTHVVDGGSMRYLGLIGTGFAGLVQLSRDGQHIYVATTYHSRLQRGTRTDVVEVYRASDLGFDHEIEIPPRRVQGLQIKALTSTTADDRFLLIQNSTPATSVTVVDTKERRVTAEIENPGCWGALAWPGNARRFSSVCGDGTMTTYDLDEKGALAATHASEPFFDPDTDPVFMHHEWVGDRLLFVSYHGKVHSMRMAGAAPKAEPAWDLMDAATRKQGWRPGGFQLFAVTPDGQRMVVAMHDHGAEGTHKNPAKELWLIDLAQRKRIARAPGHTALSMTFARPGPSGNALLYALSAADNRLLAFDLSRPGLPKKPLRRSEPVGETPVYLVLQ